jgi:predicted nuclease of restriction endonuclease-like RecB superfamily
MGDSVSAEALQLLRLILDTPLMRELSVAEQRYQAVLAVISDGLSILQVAQKVGVSRQTLHSWLARYETWRIEAQSPTRLQASAPDLFVPNDITSGFADGDDAGNA